MKSEGLGPFGDLNYGDVEDSAALVALSSECICCNFISLDCSLLDAMFCTNDWRTSGSSGISFIQIGFRNTSPSVDEVY